MDPSSEYRAAVATALAGRSLAGSATSNGLPRDAIRNVLKGHDPKLSRADAICRALGLTFTIGTPGDTLQPAGLPPALNPSATDRGAAPPGPSAFDPGTVDDAGLARLLAGLTDLWTTCEAHERRHLATVVAAVLNLAGTFRYVALDDRQPDPNRSR